MTTLPALEAGGYLLSYSVGITILVPQMCLGLHWFAAACWCTHSLNLAIIDGDYHSPLQSLPTMPRARGGIFRTNPVLYKKSVLVNYIRMRETDLTDISCFYFLLYQTAHFPSFFCCSNKNLVDTWIDFKPGNTSAISFTLLFSEPAGITEKANGRLLR